MRNELFALWLLFGAIPAATAQVSVEVNLPGASIGINQPVYPDLVAVPGYPVYYAPQVNANYFFYDGMYWVYARDNWYASSWYNGPWGLVGPDAVPLFILRVPVQYYREPPAYFHGWSADAAPRWDDHWGNAWSEHRHGWDTWDRAAVPAPSPLPTYQRQYTGRTYPVAAQQQVLQTQNYRYQPHEVVVHQAVAPPQAKLTPAPASAAQARAAAPQAKSSAQQAQRASTPAPAAEQSAAASHRGQPPQGAPVQRSAAAKPSPQAATPAKETKQQPQQAVAHAQPQQAVAHAQPQQTQKPQPQNKAPAAEPKVAHQPQPAPQAVAQHQAPRPPQAAPHQEAPKSEERAPQGKEPAQEGRPGQEKG